MSLLDEALRAGLQPCSYSLLILALVVLGLRGARARLPALAVYYLSVSVFAWIPFMGVNPLLDGRLVGTIALLAGLLMAGWHTHWEEAPNWLGTVGVALVGAFAGATWLPCVGRELGTVLTAATRDPWPGVAGLALYLLGVMWVIVVVAAIADYTPRVRMVLATAGVLHGFRIVGAIIVLMVAIDFYSTLLSHLARVSSL